MLPLYTITTKPEAILEQCKLNGSFAYEPAYQCRPGMQLPVIIQREGQTEVVLATWGRKKPIISMDRILTKPPYNILIRRQRCAVPANCFFMIKDGQPYLVRLIHHRLFLMGGLCHYANGEFHLALLETESPDILNSMEGQIPILLAPEKAHSWLKGNEVGRVIHYADRSGSHWFDFFLVTKEILEIHRNDRKLLEPQGISKKQLEEHQKKLDALAFDKERPNRTNSKHM